MMLDGWTLQVGVSAIEHADFEGVEALALVLGGDVLSTFDAPEKAKLGHCDLIEEVMIGEDKLIRFSGVALGEARYSRCSRFCSSFRLRTSHVGFHFQGSRLVWK
jgi:hypothetical protein